MPARIKTIKSILGTLLISTILQGCSTLHNRSFDFEHLSGNPPMECSPEYLDEALALHTVIVDHDGKPLRYREGEFVDNYDYKLHLERMKANLERFYQSNSSSKDPSPTKVTIFIHGGLNSLKDSLKRSHDVTCRIYDPGNPKSQYPIFVNWDSGAGSSLLDHFFLVRQGEVRKVIGPITFPFILLEDTGKTVASAPINWYYQYFATDLRSWIFPEQPYDDACPEAYRSMASGYVNAVNALYCAEKGSKSSNRTNISLYRSNESWSDLKTFGKLFTYLLTAPTTKLVSTPLIAGFGRPAWDIMVRRTTSMFTPPTQFDIRNQLHSSDSYETRNERARKANSFDRKGALADLVKMLNDYSKDNKNLEITLIGHSMGTIVISNILRDTNAIEHMKIKNIVFMAAACSIKDMQTAVIPYLQAHKPSCCCMEAYPGTSFYNLTLHPINDADEIDWSKLDLIPRGSLLEWIDNFYTTPDTHLDRTLGKWTNIVQAINIIPEDIRPQVTIKGFGVGDPGMFGPQKHGDFDNVLPGQWWKFWDKSFWEAGKYCDGSGLNSDFTDQITQ